LAVSSGSGYPGGTVSLNVNLNAAVGESPSTVQWSLTYPAADFSAATITAGSAATSAGKSLSCNGTAGTTTCVAWGQNALMANGAVANITMTLSNSAPDSSASLQLSATTASDASGDSLSTSAANGIVAIELPALDAFTCPSTQLTPPASLACSVTLDAPAPSGGASIALSASPPDVGMPPSVVIPQGSSSAGITVTGSPVSSPTAVTLTASYLGVSEGFGITVNPSVSVIISGLSVSPLLLTYGKAATGTVTLSSAAPSGGAVVALSSSNAAAVSVPSSVSVPAGATSTTFPVTPGKVSSAIASTLTASYAGSTITTKVYTHSSH